MTPSASVGVAEVRRQHLRFPGELKRQVYISLIALLDLQAFGIEFADSKSKFRDVVFILKFLDFYGRENFIFLGFQLLVFSIFSLAVRILLMIDERAS